jgi:catechol 2,3-dioxygenase-like lactoylglutathione lyase family enzyme
MKITPVLLSLSVLCTAQGIQRPRILGDAHMALYVSDLQKARVFYKDFLGYGEPFNLKAKDSDRERIAFIKLNEDQYLELFAEKTREEGLQLNHISFSTDDAQAMRKYLASRGVKVPDKVGKGQIGNSNFNINDPDGHIVEIVQYEPAGWTRREQGKFLPDTRISTHMAHFGVVIGSLDAALKFYGDILGFQDIWRGPPNGKTLSWVNMKVPDGTDYLEFMLYSASKPVDTKSQKGTKNHICLVVPDIEKSVAILESRRAATGYTKPIEIKVGQNGKRQANLFDPDETRVELMEPKTFDGQPVPSSAAPPPMK